MCMSVCVCVWCVSVCVRYVCVCVCVANLKSLRDERVYLNSDNGVQTCWSYG